jgi:hypothetical protein
MASLMDFQYSYCWRHNVPKLRLYQNWLENTKFVIDYNQEGSAEGNWFASNDKCIGMVDVYPVVLNYFQMVHDVSVKKATRGGGYRKGSINFERPFGGMEFLIQNITGVIICFEYTQITNHRVRGLIGSSLSVTLMINLY